MAVYAEFVKVIKQLGYNNKISIEGRLRATSPIDMYNEVAAALRTLQNLFAV